MAAEMNVVIEGIAPYNGEYEFDTEKVMTTREWRWLKQIGGYSPRTLDEAIADYEPDVVISLAVIAMCRAGKITREEVLEVAEKLIDYPYDGSYITLSGGEESEPEIPPALTLEPDGASPKSSSENVSSTSPSNASSGNGSPTASDPSAANPSPTGITK